MYISCVCIHTFLYIISIYQQNGYKYALVLGLRLKSKLLISLLSKLIGKNIFFFGKINNITTRMPFFCLSFFLVTVIIYSNLLTDKKTTTYFSRK